MPRMRRSDKAQAVEQLARRLQDSKALLLTDFRGLNVQQATELRRKLRESGVEYRVIKNTLISLAAKQAGLQGLEPVLVGPTAIAFVVNDPVPAAKVLSDFARDNRFLTIKAGVLGGRLVEGERVKDLAGLPPREVLLAQVLGGLQGPIAGFAGVLSATLRSLVYAVEAVRKQREAAQGAAQA